MVRKVGLGVLASGCMLGCLLLAAAPASALSCGQTLNKSVKLKANMSCLSSGGLIAGRSGITIDLNGRTITGAPGSFYGIDVDGKSNVTIRNGKIRNFNRSINIDNAVRTTVDRVRLELGGSKSYDGIYSNYSTGGTFRRVTVVNANNAFYLYFGSNNDVIDSRANSSGTGAYVYYELNDRILGMTVNGTSGSQYGVNVNYGFQNLIQGGVFKKAGYGIYATSERQLRLIRNKANGNNSYGIYMASNDPDYGRRITVVSNVANNNGNQGMYSSYMGGAVGGGNRASGNTNTNCYQVSCNA